jgi:hypothetical protein
MTDTNGETSLHVAARNGSEAVLRALLGAAPRAAVDRTNHNGEAVQFEPIKSKMSSPGSKRFKLI